MNTARRVRLESSGCKVGSTTGFLGRSRDEAELVKMKLSLSESLKRHRLKRKLTQEALAERLGSSQSRVAKLEAGARGISLDLRFRALFATGVTTAEIAREIRPRRRSAA